MKHTPIIRQAMQRHFARLETLGEMDRAHEQAIREALILMCLAPTAASRIRHSRAAYALIEKRSAQAVHALETYLGLSEQ